MKKGSLLLILPMIIVLSCATSRVSLTGSKSSDRNHGYVVQKIDEILEDPALKQAQVGIKAVSMRTGRVVYAHQTRKLFTPASNMKLYATASALHFLGPEFRLKTIASCDSQIHHGDWEGTLS